MMGKVYLVGAGPGDPELITVKGKRLLAAADCVLYDHLAPPELLDLAPAHAERVYVGKQGAHHALPQAAITELLIDRARTAAAVVRLKGGDPFLFGRGAEEAEALACAGIPFEVVPGVPAALGAAAYTGVPLTHREWAASVTIVTGHDLEKVNWEQAARAGTLVIYMGLDNLEAIMDRLVRAGRSPATPALAVRWATRPRQSSVTAPIGELPAAVAAAALAPPVTVIVGEVVTLRDRLSWFERLPLFGRRIVVTRAPGQAAGFLASLREAGAEAIELAAIAVCPAPDYSALDRALSELATYDWLIFTSANGVRFFLDRLRSSPVDLRSLRGRLCAIGPATRRELEALHLKVDLTPHEYVAEQVVAAFAQFDIAGRRILLPRAAVARDLIPAELTRRGARVDVVEAYRTVPPPNLPLRAREVFAQRPHWVVFTSTSTVRNLVAAAGLDSFAGARIASIGPVTSAAAAECGLAVTTQAQEYTMDGVLEAIIDYEAASPSAVHS